MPHTIIVRLLLISLWLLPGAAVAGKPSAQTPGLTPAADIAVPSKPLATRGQLDTYLRDTPAERSPLNWLTPAGRKRFLASIVFGQHGVSGFSTEELSYDLTREQAYRLLQLFGIESSAVNMDARIAPRPASSDGASGALEQAYDALTAAEDSGDKPAAIHVYETAFAPSQTDIQRHALGNADMELLFRATGRMADLDSPPTHLAELRADFTELERRHAVDRPQVGHYYDTLLRARQTDQAQALLASHPILDRNPPPLMRSANRIHGGQPSLWVANANRRELMRFRFNIHAPSQIVVLGSTGCHYSVDAARALEADPLLSGIFRDYAQWVAPSADLTAFDAIRTWNRTYPDMRLGISYDEHELPMVKRFDTPTFYFLDHGALVDTVVGWPDGGNLEAIRHGLREIHLLR